MRWPKAKGRAVTLLPCSLSRRYVLGVGGSPMFLQLLGEALPDIRLRVGWREGILLLREVRDF